MRRARGCGGGRSGGWRAWGAVPALAFLPGCLLARVSGGVTLPIEDRPVVDDHRTAGGQLTASLQVMYFDAALRAQVSPEAASVSVTPSLCYPVAGIADAVFFVPCAGADLAALHVVEGRVGFGALSPVVDLRAWIPARRMGPGDLGVESWGLVVAVPVSYEWRWARDQRSALAVGLQVGVSYTEVGLVPAPSF